MIVIQIDGMNKDVDDGSALVHIVGGHLADIVQKGQNLRLGQRDLLVFLNSYNLLFLSATIVAVGIAEIECAEVFAYKY